MIYLDYAAATPVLPRVFEAMKPYFSELFGNPSSLHSAGTVAKAGIEFARQSIAKLIDCHPAEIIFTSGTTEAINLGIFGSVSHDAQAVVVGGGHSAGREALKKSGATLKFVGLQSDGSVKIDNVIAAVTSDTRLVYAHWVDNETGVTHPIHELAVAIDKLNQTGKYQIIFMVDAAQTPITTPISLIKSPVHLLAIGSNKIYGPKGIGALFCRRGTSLHAQIVGGNQEGGRRAGTPNVPAIVGFGAAALEALEHSSNRFAHFAKLRREFIGALNRSDLKFRVNESSVQSPHIASLTIFGVNAEELVLRLDAQGICISAASACESTLRRSATLSAMGLSTGDILSTIRVSFGVGNTLEEVIEAANVIAQVSSKMLG